MIRLRHENDFVTQTHMTSKQKEGAFAYAKAPFLHTLLFQL